MTADARQRLVDLDDSQSAELLRGLLARLDDRPPAVDEEAIAGQQEEDSDYLREIAASVGLDDGASAEGGSPRAFLLALYDNVPDLRPRIASELDTAELRPETLDFGVTLMGLVVVSVAAAIMRPRVKVHKKSSGDTTESTTEVEVRGVDDIGTVLKAVLPFI